MHWLDGIPIIGHVRSLIYKYCDYTEQSSEAFKSATHNTGVACFGVLGGYYIDFPGSVAGSIIGGLFVDAAISKWAPNDYGYFRYYSMWRNRGMEAYTLFDLLHLAVKDTVTGLLTYYAYNEFKVWMQSLNNIESQNETDINSLMEKKGNGFWKHIDLNTITVILEISELRGIPTSSVKWYYRSDNEKPASSERIIHILCVKLFGFLGGRLAVSIVSENAWFVGSFFGGLVGGLFIDAAISTYTGTPYGYIEYLGENKKNVEKIELLARSDILKGIVSFDQINIFCTAMQRFFYQENLFVLNRISLQEETGRDMSGIIYALEIQKDMSGTIWMYECRTKKDHGNEREKCRLAACKKLTIIEDSYSSYRELWLSLTVPEEKSFVENISQLEPGDHLVYRRRLYDHHAIVGEVSYKEGKYTAYEQSSVDNVKENMFREKAMIKEIEKSFDADTLYKIDHIKTGITKEHARNNAHFICHHATDTVFQKRPYHLLSNNCEHFANFCAIGLYVSYQSRSFFSYVMRVEMRILVTIIYSHFNHKVWLLDALYLYQHVMNV